MSLTSCEIPTSTPSMPNECVYVRHWKRTNIQEIAKIQIVQHTFRYNEEEQCADQPFALHSLSNQIERYDDKEEIPEEKNMY